MIPTKVQRNNDLITGKEDLEHLFTIPNIPVFMGCVDLDQDLATDLVFDCNFYISRSSGMVQLNPLIPLEILYQNSHSSGKVGKMWIEHHKAFAQFINKYNPKKVFEIGAGHGLLSQNYLELDPNIDWTFIDPNPKDIPGVKIIKGFFGPSTQINNVDMIVHSHVLEHLYNPSEFFETLSTVEIGTKMCFSVPALKSFIEQKFTNALNFEHTYFCLEEYIEWWLKKSGFNILEKKYYVDHSIFYATEKTNILLYDEIPNLYEENKQLLNEFYNYQFMIVKNLNNQIQNTPNVYLFGAHVFSQILLSFGLQRSKIKCILDNDDNKQNKRLYGTNLIVKSPKVLSEEINPHVIIKAGIYDQEIKDQLLTINPNVVFIV